jgi:hypothetical protein
MPTGSELPPPDPGLAGRLITLMTRRRTIRRTLITVLVIALGPLALLAAAQGVARLVRDARHANMALAEAVAETASPDRNRVARLQLIVELLALQGDLALRSPTACGAVREATGAGLPFYMTLAVADASGRIGCSSAPGWAGRLLPPDGIADGSPLGLPGHALVLGPERIGREAGVARVAAVVNLDGLAESLEPPQRNKGAITLIADGSGRLLAGPFRGPLTGRFQAMAEGPFTVEDANGLQWTLASALLRPGETPDTDIYLLFARPRIAAFGKDWWFFASSFALPLLALLLASLTIWKGASRSILRWVTELRQTSGRIAHGQYRVPVERFEDAPSEVRTLVADIQRMARTISDRDRTLKAALDQQRELTLELNHRVRNNLQLISSYLTLNAASTKKADVLAQVQLRVSALSLVHRLLYTHFDRPALRADVLLHELRQLLARACGIVDIEVDCPERAVGVDAAVPMALGVVEAAAWLQAEGMAVACLSLAVEDEEAQLTIGTAGPHPLAIGESPRLLADFARQLGGDLVQMHAISGFALQLRFAALNLDRAFHSSIGNKSRVPWAASQRFRK